MSCVGVWVGQRDFNCQKGPGVGLKKLIFPWAHIYLTVQLAWHQGWIGYDWKHEASEWIENPNVCCACGPPPRLWSWGRAAAVQPCLPLTPVPHFQRLSGRCWIRTRGRASKKGLTRHRWFTGWPQSLLDFLQLFWPQIPSPLPQMWVKKIKNQTQP